PALKRVAAMPKAADVSRTVIVVTDGYVSVESEVFRLVRDNLDQANVFAFGIGSSVNRHLIEGIARAGQGEAFIVTRPEDATATAERLRRVIDSPVLTKVTARLDGLDAYDVEPRHLPDVLAGRPVVVFGKWRGDPAQVAGARLVVEGRTAEGAYMNEVSARDHEDATSSALRQLWARRRIATLADQEALEGGGAQKDAITALGLNYSLLTQYTSFIAVDQVVRNSNPALMASVKQPLPMPAGVSNLAIGAEVPSTPEPEAWLALAVTLAIVGAALPLRRRRAGRRS
ncbi:MAG: trypsin, partial [Caldimonas sp.]